MKKIFCLTLILLLAGCTGETVLTKAKDTKACLKKEAEARIADGSALASPVRTTAKQMLDACLTKEEQTPGTQQMAQGVLTGLLQKATEPAQ